MNINTLYRKTKNGEGLAVEETKKAYKLLVSYDREITELMKRIAAISRVVDGVTPDWKNTRYGRGNELISADSMSLLEQIEWITNCATNIHCPAAAPEPVADRCEAGGEEKVNDIRG